MNLSLKTLGPDPGDSKALATDRYFYNKKNLFFCLTNIIYSEISPLRRPVHSNSKEKLDAIFV